MNEISTVIAMNKKLLFIVGVYVKGVVKSNRLAGASYTYVYSS